MFTNFKIFLAAMWNIRTIFEAIDLKTFPGILDPVKLQLWLLDKAKVAITLAVQLTPNWKWDEIVVEEVRKYIADPETWGPIYWAVSQGIVPLFSVQARTAFIAQLPPTSAARYRAEIVRTDVAAADPVLIASVLSIFVSVIRIIQYFSGSNVETPDVPVDVIPDISNVEL